MTNNTSGWKIEQSMGKFFWDQDCILAVRQSNVLSKQHLANYFW